ncbi:MAG: hypothetical protein ACOX6V_04935 [Patescibacteria group bacterium]|jgi:hypothetical protein
MVSVHTAHQIRQSKIKIRQETPSYKSIFHPDHLPATVGMFGFIVAFSMLSLQLAISPYTGQSLKEARHLEVFEQSANTEEVEVTIGKAKTDDVAYQINMTSENTLPMTCKLDDPDCYYMTTVQFINNTDQPLYRTTFYTGVSSPHKDVIQYQDENGNWTHERTEIERVVRVGEGITTQLRITPVLEEYNLTATLYVDARTCNNNVNPPDCYAYGASQIEIPISFTSVTEISPSSIPTSTLSATLISTPTATPSSTPEVTVESALPPSPEITAEPPSTNMPSQVSNLHDLDSKKLVNVDDIDTFYQLYSSRSLEIDFNKDGRVNALDYKLVLGETDSPESPVSEQSLQ